MKEHLGDTHPLTLATRKKLADWQGRAGDPVGAAKALEDLLPTMHGVLGAKHPDTLATRYKHAYWQGRAGNPKGAAKALEDLLPTMKKVLGAKHPDTLTTRAALAALTSQSAAKPD